MNLKEIKNTLKKLCDSWLPHEQIKETALYALEKLKKNGFVIIDSFHPNGYSVAKSGSIYIETYIPDTNFQGWTLRFSDHIGDKGSTTLWTKDDVDKWINNKLKLLKK